MAIPSPEAAEIQVLEDPRSSRIAGDLAYSSRRQLKKTTVVPESDHQAQKR